MSPARYFALLLLVTLFAILGVAQHTRLIHLGYRAERLAAERTLLAETRRQLLCEISALSHPARIARETERLKIALLEPVALSQASAGERMGGSEAHRPTGRP